MRTVQDVLDVIESIAPVRWALPEDNVGLLVGDPSAEIRTATVSLDWSMELADFAESKGSGLMVAHHPVIWNPLTKVTEDLRGRFLRRVISRDVNYIASHTNWDAAPGGISDTMASLLGLQNVSPLFYGASVEYCKIVTFAPFETKDAIIDAMAQAGAGRIGLYERCAFSSEGIGTFCGLPGSSPVIGQSGQIENAPEERIEMRLRKSDSEEVIRALKSVHPYEEPAFDLFPLAPTVEMPLGRIGELPNAITLAKLQSLADKTFDTRSQCWGDPSKSVKRIAVAGGAADDGWHEALLAMADAMVTGEVKQHNGVEASGLGLGMIASGHYGTEHPGCAALRDRLQSALPEIEWHLFEPVPGTAGRPT